MVLNNWSTSQTAMAPHWWQNDVRIAPTFCRNAPKQYIDKNKPLCVLKSWVRSRIVDLIFTVRSVVLREAETSRVPHWWLNNAPNIFLFWFWPHQPSRAILLLFPQHYVEGLLNSRPRVESVHTEIAIFEPPPCMGIFLVPHPYRHLIKKVYLIPPNVILTSIISWRRPGPDST